MVDITLDRILSSYSSAAKQNSNFDKIEVAVEDALSKSTGGTMFADIDMNSKQLINTGDPILPNHVVTKEYIDAVLTDSTAFTNVAVGLLGLVKPVLNNAALTSLSVLTGLASGGLYITAGHTAVNDGGQGIWRYDASSVATANIGTVLAHDSLGGRFIRLHGDVINPLWFKAAGSGSVNDATPIQASITAAAGKILDLQGLTYRVDSALTGVSNIKLKNGTLDFSSALGSTAVGLQFLGTQGSADTSMSALTYSTRTITVAATAAYPANTDLFILSDDIWSTDSNEKRGQWAKVKAITSGTTLDLYGASYDDYSTGIKLYKPAMLQNIVLEDLVLIGRGVGYAQHGVQFHFCKNIDIRNVTFRHWAYAGCEFYSCLDISVGNSEVHHGDDATGASYGFGFYNTCERFSVTDCKGSDHRHFFTVGGTTGVSRFGSAKGNTCNSMTDSFLDTHPAAEFVVFANNVGEHETAYDGDGIVYQGANGTITNNQVISANTAGILYQACAYHNRDSAIIQGNLINRIESASGYGILVEAKTPLRSLIITGNSILSAVNQGIVVITNGANVFSASIANNTVTASAAEALYLNAATTDFMQRVSVTGNIFHRANTSGPVIDCFAGTEGRGQYLAFTGNTVINGTYSIRCDAEWERVLIVGNILRDFATAATELTGVGVTVNANNLTS